MKITPTHIPEVLVIEPKVYSDNRGYFFESFNQKAFDEIIGKKIVFVQDNHSKSIKNVLRGLHYQCAPKSQGKLVRVIKGEIFDVAVDTRRESSTYGHWVGEFLSSENKKQMWIPTGFAHGFLTLSDTAELLYKATEYYELAYECCIAWDDPDVQIDWPLAGKSPLLSDKDRRGHKFMESNIFTDVSASP